MKQDSTYAQFYGTVLMFLGLAGFIFALSLKVWPLFIPIKEEIILHKYLSLEEFNDQNTKFLKQKIDSVTLKEILRDHPYIINYDGPNFHSSKLYFGIQKVKKESHGELNNIKDFRIAKLELALTTTDSVNTLRKMIRYEFYDALLEEQSGTIHIQKSGAEYLAKIINQSISGIPFRSDSTIFTLSTICRELPFVIDEYREIPNMISQFGSNVENIVINDTILTNVISRRIEMQRCRYWPFCK